MKGSTVFFFEKLSWRSLILVLLPAVIRNLYRPKYYSASMFVVDASPIWLMVGKLISRLCACRLERMVFNYEDVKELDGLSSFLRIWHQDLGSVQKQILQGSIFQELTKQALLIGNLPQFIAKEIAATDPFTSRTLCRALFLVKIASWKVRQTRDDNLTTLLVLERRPWQDSLEQYAAANAINLRPVPPGMDFKLTLFRLTPIRLLMLARSVRDQYRRHGFIGYISLQIKRTVVSIFSRNSEDAYNLSNELQSIQTPKIAVDHYGVLNLDNPERNSELFFWQQSKIPGDNVALIFSIPRLPLTKQILVDLKKYNMTGIPISDGSNATGSVDTFHDRSQLVKSPKSEIVEGAKGPEAAWLNYRITKYQEIRKYWNGLAEAYNLKVYATWAKYDSIHCAITDGIRDSGGVTAVYQRAYEGIPSSEIAIGSDIAFGFSPQGAEIERASGSQIPYHVATGYLGDHRFEILKPQALETRNRLLENGAKHIMAYFDENSSDDPRWLIGHQVPREDYRFLLEKVLSESWFGLLIKPKVPGFGTKSLRNRLGPVAELLMSAEATGRCVVYQDRSDGSHQGWYPPVAAALAADVSVHGDLFAATAGMESALAGMKSLLLDRTGWSVSPLYKLGVGQVVFNGWDDIWSACIHEWFKNTDIPGFGDWSYILEDLDPFRDGKAAERMGTYILWLIEGFQAGLDRDRVMADAAHRYGECWGWDKVNFVTSNTPYSDHRSKEKPNTQVSSG